jgi:hypothetical protein
MPKRSAKLTISSALIAIASTLALTASICVLYFLQADYLFLQFSDPDFLARVITIVYGLVAFILGIFSVRQILGKRRFLVSALGGTLLIVSGTLFFIRASIPTSTRMDYPLSWWLLVEIFLVLPTVLCAIAGLTILIKRRHEFELKEGTFTLPGTILILCSITAALLAVISYNSYHTTLSYPYGTYQVPLYSGVVNVCALALTFISGILFLKKKAIPIAAALIVLAIISTLSLPLVFNVIGFTNTWLGALQFGLSYELPIILPSIVALVLVVFTRKHQNKAMTPPQPDGI